MSGRAMRTRAGAVRGPGGLLADKVTSPFWEKAQIAFLSHEPQKSSGAVAFRTSQPRPNTKGGVVSYRPTTREHTLLRAACWLARTPSASLRARRRTATAKAWRGIARDPSRGVEAGCGERCRDCAPRCGTAAPTGTSTWTSPKPLALCAPSASPRARRRPTPRCDGCATEPPRERRWRDASPRCLPVTRRRGGKRTRVVENETSPRRWCGGESFDTKERRSATSVDIR